VTFNGILFRGATFAANVRDACAFYLPQNIERILESIPARDFPGTGRTFFFVVVVTWRSAEAQRLAIKPLRPPAAGGANGELQAFEAAEVRLES
jgi:hypothetical protein